MPLSSAASALCALAEDQGHQRHARVQGTPPEFPTSSQNLAQSTSKNGSAPRERAALHCTALRCRRACQRPPPTRVFVLSQEMFDCEELGGEVSVAYYYEVRAADTVTDGHQPAALASLIHVDSTTDTLEPNRSNDRL